MNAQVSAITREAIDHAVRRNPAAARDAIAEAVLKDAMEQMFLAKGFGHLHRTVAKLEGEIGREHRLALALQGWIA